MIQNSSKACVKTYNPNGNESTILYCVEVEIEDSKEALDATTFPNEGVKKYALGQREVSMNAKVYEVNSFVMAAISDDTPLRVQVFDNTEDAEPSFDEVMYISAIGKNYSTDGLLGKDLKFVKAAI